MSEALAFIKFAIDIEIAGRKFYEECLKHTDDQRALNLFEYLVDEEKRHEETLKELLNKKSENDPAKVQAAVEKYNKTGLENPMFSKDDLAAITDKDALVMEMFNRSAEQEKKGINFYLDLENTQEDPEIKEFFHDLAKQEVIHKKKIVSLGMHLFGMDEEEEELTPEMIEKELKSSKVIIKEIDFRIEKCEFKPKDIKVNKGETVVLKVMSDSPAGLRMINFGVNEYISPNKEMIIQFIADTAGEFEYFSNVPCSLGNEKMRGKLIIEGENEVEDPL